MKKKFKLTRKAVITGFVALIGIGGISGTALAAGTFEPVTLNSYGVFSYDDGNPDNNNGYKYDIFLDASDLRKINDNVNVLKETTDSITTNVTNLQTNTNVKVEKWDPDTQTLYLAPVE